MRAMILAAGLGERMRPLTEHTPKPLLRVAGRPLLDYHLMRLAAAKVQHVVINHSWLGEQIVAHVGDGAQFGLTVQYSPEVTPLETLGGIVQALAFLGDEFIVINGDIYCDYDLSQLQLAPALEAQLVLVPNPEHHRDGDFALHDSRCNTDLLPRYTFAGIARYRADFFRDCVAGKAPLAPLLRQKMQQQLIGGELHRGYWSDIGTPQRLQQCDDYLLRQGSRA
jgi:MurNAc alpha-1-phosphate uridylyltransferase